MCQELPEQIIGSRLSDVYDFPASDDVQSILRGVLVAAGGPVAVVSGSAAASRTNDPGLASTRASGGVKEFLVTFTPAEPEEVPYRALKDATAAEAVRAKELAGQGHLMRLWQTPGAGRGLGLWHARDAAEMQTVLDSLPLAPWLSMETTPLSEHPSDPGPVRS
jgi:muconolactone delta-isomerase